VQTPAVDADDDGDVEKALRRHRVLEVLEKSVRDMMDLQPELRLTNDAAPQDSQAGHPSDSQSPRRFSLQVRQGHGGEREWSGVGVCR
jgi:hypothetical protein